MISVQVPSAQIVQDLKKELMQVLAHLNPRTNHYRRGLAVLQIHSHQARLYLIVIPNVYKDLKESSKSDDLPIEPGLCPVAEM